MMTIEEVERLEERLRQAMLAGDVAELDQLIADRLLFVTADGTRITKAQDLEVHRSRRLQLTAITPSERRIERFGAVAVVNVIVEMRGHFAARAFDGRFRCTRIWLQDVEGRLQVIAGHLSAIA